jgi:hypothetical protein
MFATRSSLRELLFEPRLRFLAESFDPSPRPPLQLRVIFILPTAGRHTQSLPLTNQQEFFSNRVRNELASVPLINEPVEIGANLFRKRYVNARCAHAEAMVYLNRFVMVRRYGSGTLSMRGRFGTGTR